MSNYITPAQYRALLKFEMLRPFGVSQTSYDSAKEYAKQNRQMPLVDWLALDCEYVLHDTRTFLVEKNNPECYTVVMQCKLSGKRFVEFPFLSEISLAGIHKYRNENGLIITNWSGIQALQNHSALVTKIAPITFDNMLECLPPVSWCNRGDYTVFMFSELQTANIGKWYAQHRTTGECYTFNAPVNVNDDDIIKVLP